MTIEVREDKDVFFISCKEMQCDFPVKKDLKKLSIILTELIKEYKELNEQTVEYV